MGKVLDCDGISPKAVKALEDLDHTVDVKSDLPKDELPGIINDYDAMVVRSATKVREPFIDKMETIKVIVRAGVGIDNIDHEYARKNGIPVRNTPAASSDSVAELALAHIFALYRFIPQANITMRKGEWNKKKYKGREVNGKKLGIIGIGRIGRSLAKKAIALGMEVLAVDPYVKTCDIDGVCMSDMDKVLAAADIISLHVPSGKKPLIGKDEFGKMKKSAILINCARGGVVDEDALCDALDNDEISAAAIDVYVEEPTKNERLVNHPKVSVTPHIGASTKEAQDRVGEEVVSVLQEYIG
ncbi:MAG: D-2-hydroxyacid dehydrogenase [Candidatus Zixiibacteriota bacterium]